MDFLADFVAKKRGVVFVIVALLALALGAGAARLKTDMSVPSILPKDNPEIAYFLETADRFGSANINMAAIETDDLFSHESLTRLRAVTEATAKVDGVRFSMSVTNLLDMQPDGEGSISVRPLVPKESIPTDPAQLKQIRDTVLGNPLLAGNLVSLDGRAGLVTIMLSQDADRATVGGRLIEAVRGAAGDVTWYVGGLEMVYDLVGRLVSSPRMIAVMSAAFGLLVVLLFVTVGCGRATLWTLLVTGLATLASVGVLGATGATLSLFSSMAPLLVVIVAIPFPVLFVKVYERAVGDAPSKVRATLRDAGLPLAMSGVFVAAAALSSLSTPWAMFRDTGVAVAAGALASALLSITLLPAILSGQKRPSALGAFDRAVNADGAAATAGQKRGLFLFLWLAVAGFAVISTAAMPTNVNPMATFPEGSEPLATEDLMQRQFGGSQLFMINFRSADVRHPAVLEQMSLVTKRLRRIPDVNYPQSIADVLAMLNTNLNNEPAPPDTMGKITNLWFMLEGQPQVDMLIDPKFTDAIVQARIGKIDSAVVAPAVDAVAESVSRLKPDWVSVDVATRPAAEREAWAKVVAEKAAEFVALDAKRLNGRDVDAEALALALAPLRSRPIALAEAEREDLRRRWTRYFESDESDVALPDGYDAASLVTPLLAVAAFDEKTLADTLAVHLDAAILAADPQGPSYAATTLLGIYETVAKRARHRDAKIVTAQALNLPADDASDIWADLMPDLWRLNAETANVTPALYHEITGADPAPEEIIHIEARLTGWPVVNTRMNRALPRIFAVAGGLALLIALVGAFRLGGIGGAATVGVTLLVVLGAMAPFGVALDNILWPAILLALGLAIPASVAAVRPGVPAALLPLCALGLMGGAAMAAQAQLGVFVTAAALSASLAALFLAPILTKTESR